MTMLTTSAGNRYLRHGQIQRQAPNSPNQSQSSNRPSSLHLESDSVHFGFAPSLPLSPNLQNALARIKRTLDAAELKKTTFGGYHIRLDGETPPTLTITFPPKMDYTPSQSTENFRPPRKIGLEFIDNNGQWELLPKIYSQLQTNGLNPETAVNDLEAQTNPGFFQQLEAQTVPVFTQVEPLVSYAASNTAVQELVLPLTQFLDQFPQNLNATPAMIIREFDMRNGQTPPVGLFVKKIHPSRWNSKLINYQFTLGSPNISKSGEVPLIQFEFTPNGELLQNSLSPEEGTLLLQNKEKIHYALLLSLLHALGYSTTPENIPKMVHGLMKLETAQDGETVNIGGNTTVSFTPGIVKLSVNNGAWGIEWSHVPASNSLQVKGFHNLSIQDPSVNMITSNLIFDALQTANTFTQKGYNQVPARLFNHFVSFSRLLPEVPNRFFDPSNHLMVWPIPGGQLVFGDLDDLMQSKDVPPQLKEFATAEALDSPSAFAKRYGKRVNPSDVIILGFYPNNQPQQGDVALLLMPQNMPHSSAPQTVIVSPEHFDPKKFDTYVRMETMAQIGKAIRMTHEPQTFLSPMPNGTQQPVTLVPVEMGQQLTAWAQEIIDFVPGHLEEVTLLARELAGRKDVFKAGVQGVGEGLREELNAQQKTELNEYLKRQAELRKAKRNAHQSSREIGARVIAANTGTEPGKPSVVGPFLKAFWEELTGMAMDRIRWQMSVRHTTQVGHLKADMEGRLRAVNQAAQLNQTQVDALLSGLSRLLSLQDQMNTILTQMITTNNNLALHTETLPHAAAHQFGGRLRRGRQKHRLELDQFDERAALIRNEVNAQQGRYRQVVDLFTTITKTAEQLRQSIYQTNAQLAQLPAGTTELGSNRIGLIDQVRGDRPALPPIQGGGAKTLPAPAPQRIRALMPPPPRPGDEDEE